MVHHLRAQDKPRTKSREEKKREQEKQSQARHRKRCAQMLFVLPFERRKHLTTHSHSQYTEAKMNDNEIMRLSNKKHISNQEKNWPNIHISIIFK